VKKIIAGIGFLIFLSFGMQQAAAETFPGSVTADTIWTKEGSPYKLSTIEVSPGATLTVEPGVEIIGLNGGPAWIDVKGKIKVQGTAQERVKIKDVIIKGFNFTDSSVQLEYASLSRTYAGGFLVQSQDQEVILRNNVFSGGTVLLGEPKVDMFIENNLFEGGTQLSVKNGTANILIKRNTFFHTGSQASIELNCNEPNCKNANTIISENNFFGYASFFVEVRNGVGLTYDASNNYWNTTDTALMKQRLYDGIREPYSKAVLNYSPIAYKPFANGHPLGDMENPGVNKIGDSDAFVTGRTDADTIVKVWKNGVLIGEGTSAADGTYHVTIPVQKAETMLTVTAVDSFGRVASGTVTNVSDTTAPEAPTVNKVNDQATKVEGSTEPMATVIVKVDGIEKREKADANGHFSVEITQQKAGNVLLVQAMDGASNYSEFTTVTVVDENPPAKPVITSDELTDQSTYLAGTTEPGAKVKVVQGDQVIASIYADSFGNFSFVFNQKFNGGTVITVVAEDGAGNSSETVTLTVKDTTPPHVDIDWARYVTEKSTEVYGTAEPGAKIDILKNGNVIGSDTAKSDGTYAIPIPLQAPGTQLVIMATDAAGNNRSITVTVIDLPDPLPLTVNPVNTQSTVLTGTTVPNGWVNITISGVLHTIKADSAGKFTFALPLQKEGTVIKIQSHNDEGQWSEEISVTVTWKAPSGFYKDAAGNTYYYDPITGVKKTGWLLYNTKWYYFEADGKMKIGWKQIGKTWYYLNTDGTMRVGWLSYNGKWYYFPASGAMQTGLASVNGKWYYFNSGGAMLTGWQKISEKWYYFNPSSGAGQIGWTKLDGKWYYFNTSAIMQTGWLKQSGKWYYLNTGGAMVTGWNTIGGKRYYFNANGVWMY
jgi:glucan-binding YG repeat protein